MNRKATVQKEHDPTRFHDVTPEPGMADWWSISGGRLAEVMHVLPADGLMPQQVGPMQERFGKNLFPGAGASGFWHLLWQSLKSPMIILLLAVAAISLALGHIREAVVMVFVVVMYILVELVNKRRTDRTMARLRELQQPAAAVRRAGIRVDIPVSEVCVGDILLIVAGTRIAADARLLEAVSMLVDEAALTGESAPQVKDTAAAIPARAPLAERPTAVFAGTTVLDGSGEALVMAVGPQSQMGRLSFLAAHAAPQQTPLQSEMKELARFLAIAAILASALIALAGWFRGYDWQQMVLTWLTLTFLMVPGQPPIIITMALSIAAFELARQHVVVRRLQGAETLGSVSVVLSDKTGTLTENKMILAGIIFQDERQAVYDALPSSSSQDPLLEQTPNMPPLSARATFFRYALAGIPPASGDPADRALITTAAGQPVSQPASQPGRLVRQSGFTAGKFFRSLDFSVANEIETYLAGSPEQIIAMSSQVLLMNSGETAGWCEAEKVQMLSRVDEYARQGMRVTAYAYRHTSGLDAGSLAESGHFTFIGCAVFIDPLRPEVKTAIRDMAGAGIRTIMVTGDNPATASHVAGLAGIRSEHVVTGPEMDHLSDQALAGLLKEDAVFARTTSEHKLRLVEILKKEQEVVAVTGDGINDAPALSTADIGVAMGIKGTDVAREAADLVLTDDNYAHMPMAAAIGRKAYDNFRKGILYYLSAKAVLLVIFMVPLILGLPFPLSPIQIIAVELLMDLASSTIFTAEAAEKGLMKEKPRKPAHFMSRRAVLEIIRNMTGLAAVILAVYAGSLGLGFSLASARTVAFATWLLGHIQLALIVKQARTSLWRRGFAGNRTGLAWLIGLAVLTALITLWPPLYPILGTAALAPVQWLMVIGGSVLASGWIEVRKLIQGR